MRRSHQAQISPVALVWMQLIRKPRAKTKPTDFTPQIGSTICDRLFVGEPLREICSDPDMPDETTLLRWLRRHPEFCDEYAFTRRLQAQDLLLEACTIAAGRNRLPPRPVG